MATIKLRTNGTTGVVPSPAVLSLGEVAINTADGFVWSKKNDASLFRILTDQNSIKTLADVDSAMVPNINDTMSWDGSKWTSAAPSGGGGSAGAAIAMALIF